MKHEIRFRFLKVWMNLNYWEHLQSWSKTYSDNPDRRGGHLYVKRAISQWQVRFNRLCSDNNSYPYWTVVYQASLTLNETMWSVLSVFNVLVLFKWVGGKDKGKISVSPSVNKLTTRERDHRTKTRSEFEKELNENKEQFVRIRDKNTNFVLHQFQRFVLYLQKECFEFLFSYWHRMKFTFLSLILANCTLFSFNSFSNSDLILVVSSHLQGLLTWWSMTTV